MNETFRPRSNFAWAASAYVLIILFGANSILVGTNTMQTIIELGVCAVLSVIVYAFWIKPKLVIGAEFVEVVNPLRTQVIRYSDIIDLETKWSLLIIHSNGKTRVWVAPASGKQRWIADKKFGWYGSGLSSNESKHGGEETMSSSLNSISGQAAYMIRERIKRSH
jgi:hypothetical protein